MEVAMNTKPVSPVSRNIWKLYSLQALTQALFMIPIIVLFFQSFGLSMKQILVLQAAFSLAILVFEIPTGYLADRWGRKPTIILGCILNIAGYLLYALSTGFWTIMAAEITIGLGASFLSGTVEAMTYDSLLEMGEEKRYRSVAANQSFLEFSTEAFCGLIGGFLAVISLYAPLWATLVPLCIASGIACTLAEPKRHVMQEGRHWKAIWDVSTHTLFKHRGLRSIILLHALISTMTLTLFWFTQPYQKLIGLPIAYYGVVHAVIVLSGAFASRLVPKLEKRMDDRVVLMCIAGCVIGCFLLLGLPPMLWGLGLFLIARVSWGMLTPLTGDMINRMTTSDVRATVLSMRSFLGRCIFVCTSPFLGAIADARSVPYALSVGGLAGGALILIVFIRIRSVWREIPS
jgi:MFS family permease